MNTELATVQAPTSVAAFTAPQVKAHVQLIQQVTRSVMKEGVHFGKIPGAGDRKSLFKPGAEVLGVTFRLAPSYRVEDLSDTDAVRYRVTCVGTHQGTGIVMGEGMGEASSSEEKYKWRASVCDEEYDATPEDRRRLKWRRGQNGAYSTKQIRTEPADIANTVLKMACKRAQVAMAINVTGASDMFSQDLEDMPDELREHLTDGDHNNAERSRGKPATQAPQQRAGNGNGATRCTERQAGMLKKKLDSSGVPENEFFTKFDVRAIEDLPFNQVDAALQWISAMVG